MSLPTSSPLEPAAAWRRVLHLALPALAVLVISTAGFMWTEGWSMERALYFTIITVSTVGYGDYDLSQEGQRFSTVAIIGGFGTMTYVVGQVIQMIVQRQLDWERVMDSKVSKLSDHYIIAGFGRIGHAVCECLHREGIPFVVVDKDRRLIEEAVRLGYVGVIEDATRDTALEACGIRRARGLACLTTSDSANIVITLAGRGICPDLSIISRAEHEDSARKLEQAGATRIISPVRSGAQVIANVILRPHAVDFLDEQVNSTDGVEFSRIQVASGSSLEGQTIADVTHGARAVVVVALRRSDGGTLVNPAGDQRLASGDTLVIGGDPGTVMELCAEAA